MSVPAWQGAGSGQPLLAAQANQFLVTHTSTEIYTGAVFSSQSTAGSGAVDGNGLWIAQSFTPATAQSAGRVVLTLAVTGSPAAVSVSIQSDNAGAPSGSALVTAVLPREFVPASAGAVSVPLPCALAASTPYWVVLAAAGDVSDFYAWSKSNQVSGASTSTDGVTWSAQGYGLLYSLSNQAIVQPLVHTWEDGGARWTTRAYAASGALSSLEEYTAAQAGGYVASARTFGYGNGLLVSVV